MSSQFRPIHPFPLIFSNFKPFPASPGISMYFRPFQQFPAIFRHIKPVQTSYFQKKFKNVQVFPAMSSHFQQFISLPVISSHFQLSLPTLDQAIYGLFKPIPAFSSLCQGDPIYFENFHHLWWGLLNQTTEDFDVLDKFIYYFCVSKGLRFVVRLGLVWLQEGSWRSLVWSRKGSWRRVAHRAAFGELPQAAAMLLGACLLSTDWFPPVQAGQRSWDIILFVCLFILGLASIRESVTERAIQHF